MRNVEGVWINFGLTIYLINEVNQLSLYILFWFLCPILKKCTNAMKILVSVLCIGKYQKKVSVSGEYWKKWYRCIPTLYLGCSDIVIIFDTTSWLLFYVMTDTWLYTIICTTESMLKNNWEHWDSVLMVINYSMTCTLKGKEKALW